MADGENDMDYVLAVSLQEHFDREVKESTSDEIVCLKEVKPPNRANTTTRYDVDAENLDYAIALSLQEETPSKPHDLPMVPIDNVEKSWDPKSVVDESWELVDPNPNIHDLFVQFDSMFFRSALTNAGVAVKWGPRMTL